MLTDAAFSGDEDVLDAATPAIKDFIAAMPEGSGNGDGAAQWAREAQLVTARDEGFVVPTQVRLTDSVCSLVVCKSFTSKS